jgi:hypothetical protein
MKNSNTDKVGLAPTGTSGTGKAPALGFNEMWISSDRWQRCLSDEGRHSLCCLRLSAEAGCRESVILDGFAKGILRSL